VTDWRVSLFPKLKGQPLPLKNEPTESLAIFPDRSRFLLGSTVNLWLFDSGGKVLWIKRTPGGVYGVNTNGQVAVGAMAMGRSDGTG